MQNSAKPNPIYLPQVRDDDNVFNYRSRLNSKEYYELLIMLAVEEGVATWSEIKQWTSAWKRMRLNIKNTLDLLERTIKSRAIHITTKEYWENKNKRANEDSPNSLLNRALNAAKKH